MAFNHDTILGLHRKPSSKLELEKVVEKTKETFVLVGNKTYGRDPRERPRLDSKNQDPVRRVRGGVVLVSINRRTEVVTE